MIAGIYAAVTWIAAFLVRTHGFIAVSNWLLLGAGLSLVGLLRDNLTITQESNSLRYAPVAIQIAELWVAVRRKN